MSDISKIVLPDGNIYNIKDTVSGYQAQLVSGTNIKTINNQSLLGSGNISISGGGSGTVTNVTAGTGLNTTSNDTATDGGSITSSGTLHLTKSGVTAGTYQGITVDKYGRVTSASNQGYTSNTGTITGIKMNGSSKGTSGVVDLGTVLTSHQDISGKVSKSGDTMTGQLLTSFKSSVAMGSYGTSQTTLANFCNEVRYSSGCAGSISLGTAVTANNVTIPTGWYNFLYSPHRSGGANGAASGDNCNYGALLLFGMTANSRMFKVRISGSSPYYNDVAEVMLNNQKGSRTDTYKLAGLVGVAISATQIRLQIPTPDGYTTATVAQTSSKTANLDYNGTDASFTFSAVSVGEKNPASVWVLLTTSGLTAYRTYGFRNGEISITLS